MSEPLEQDEMATLEAELRRALQHQRAAYERMRETQEEVDALVRRARALLARALPPPGPLSHVWESGEQVGDSQKRPSPGLGRGTGEERGDEPE